MTPPRVVYDCNIYVQALINPAGPGGECVVRARDGQAVLFVTHYILDEVRESFLKIPAKYNVTQQQAEALASGVSSIATMLVDIPEVFTYQRDPDDAHYVNVALAAHAKLIVSRDRDLLDLADEHTADGALFRQRFPDLDILDPIQFIRLLKQ
jgi:putative PIN family toxin of toxin-antitoxin system